MGSLGIYAIRKNIGDGIKCGLKPANYMCSLKEKDYGLAKSFP